MCCSKSKNVWESGPYYRGKEIFTLINDWENSIVYWEESKQRKALAGKCDSFRTVTSW